jgi:hypothetical protein
MADEVVVQLPPPRAPWPRWAIFNIKRDTSLQSTVMKLNTLVTIVLLIRFALSVLWFVVECGQKKGHCHGQLDE